MSYGSSSNARRSGTTGNTTMRIKSFPKPISEESVRSTWQHLHQAIVEIQRKNNGGLSFEELYRCAYNLVLMKHGERLYAGVESAINEHMLRIRDSILNNLNNKFLTHLSACWKDHQTAMLMIRDILMYMDRVYVTQHKLAGVYKVGMTAFCNLVLRHPVVRENLQKTLLEMVHCERLGQVVSRSLIKDTCQMFVQLGAGSLDVYVEDFEEAFLEQSREFYRLDSQTFLDRNPSASAYIQKVEQHIAAEVKWARDYLDPSTEPKILLVIEQELISRHMEQVVGLEQSGLAYMLANDRYDQLATLYRVLGRVDDGPKLINQYISLYLREQGRTIVSEPTTASTSPHQSSPQQYIADLLQLRERASRLLTNSFNNHPTFRNQINSDFEYFLNLNSHSPEYLSLFIDDQLRRGLKGLSDQDVEALFDKCIVLFRYLHEKDVFESYYKKHLARRLLLSKSQSDDQEKLIIAKLMAECGAVYTSKLEGMFKDMVISKLLMDEFSRYQQQQPDAGRVPSFDLNVRVLTTGLWPTGGNGQLQHQSSSIIDGQQTTQLEPGPSGVGGAAATSNSGRLAVPTVTGSGRGACGEQLPDNISSAFDLYRSFYLNKHSGRKLSLQLNMGYAELSALFFSTQSSRSATPNNPSPAVLMPTTSSISSSTSTNATGGSELPGSPGLITTPSTTTSQRGGGVRKYFLQVSTYQMLILLKFNSRPRFTYAELASETSIPERELKRNLLSLSIGRPSQRILCKESSSTAGGGSTNSLASSLRDIAPSDVFYINDAFVSKHIKVKVQNIAMKENEPERAETRNRVDENRRYVIEATIVRVMKARKVMGHGQLIIEVIELLKSHFVPTPLMIKQRVESLIEREFLARMEGDRRVYKYLA